MKTNIAVFFGCRSVEHEVSIISAVQAMRAINREKYDVTPVYVTKNGEMYTGENLFTIENYRDLPALLKAAEPVTLIKQGGSVFMKYLNSGLFSKKKDVQVDLAFPVVHGTNCEDGTMAGYFEFLGLPYISCDILSAAVGMDKAVFKEVLKSAGLPVLGCVTFRSRDYMTDKAAVNPRPSPYGEISQAALLCPDVIYVLLQSPVGIVYFLFLFLRSVDIHKWQTDV